MSKLEFEPDNTKKSIVCDENFIQLGKNLNDYIFETNDENEFKHLNILKLATIKRIKGEFIKFKFLNDISKEQLEKIQFSNNLETMITYYESGVNTVINMIFAFVEVIRQHYKSEKIILFGEYPNETTIIIVM